MRFARYVGTTQCVARRYQDAILSGQDVIIDWLSSSANATVAFRLDGRLLSPDIQGSVLDFQDLSILVYLADEMVDRSQALDYWTRQITCLVPVSEPERWKNHERLLKDTLGSLSGDLWEFEWLQLDKSPVMRSYKRSLPNDCDVVCLFSGGTDSLLGALQLLEAGHKVLLVGHQADGQTASAQTALAAMLRQLYPERLYLVQCRVSRSPRRNTQYRLAKKAEISHRPRSFLFLTLGVAIAAKCGINDVFMPENGLMALNIPIQKSRIGTLSTRTAHPSYMLRFLQLAREMVGFTGYIRNPFLTMSKTDMLRSLPLTLAPLIDRSISCARPARFNDRNVRHCGYCVPCIHRRIALIEAQLDSSRDYAFDVFKDFASLNRDKQQDFRAIVRFALRVTEASNTKLQTLVLSHGHFPSDVGETIGISETTNYDPWIEMLKRWAADFISKVQDNASAQTQQACGLALRKRKSG